MTIDLEHLNVGDILQFNRSGPNYWDAHIIAKDDKTVSIKWVYRAIEWIPRRSVAGRRSWLESFPIDYQFVGYTLMKSKSLEIKEIEWV